MPNTCIVYAGFREVARFVARKISRCKLIGNHFLDFYQKLDLKVKSKIKYVFELIKQVD